MYARCCGGGETGVRVVVERGGELCSIRAGGAARAGDEAPKAVEAARADDEEPGADEAARVGDEAPKAVEAA